MTHRSRLSQSIARSELECIVCGCTQEDPCILEDGPCHWHTPGLCSNPACLAEIQAQDMESMATEESPEEDPEELDLVEGPDYVVKAAAHSSPKVARRGL